MAKKNEDLKAAAKRAAVAVSDAIQAGAREQSVLAAVMLPEFEQRDGVFEAAALIDNLAEHAEKVRRAAIAEANGIKHNPVKPITSYAAAMTAAAGTGVDMALVAELAAAVVLALAAAEQAEQEKKAAEAQQEQEKEKGKGKESDKQAAIIAAAAKIAADRKAAIDAAQGSAEKFKLYKQFAAEDRAAADAPESEGERFARFAGLMQAVKDADGKRVYGVDGGAKFNNVPTAPKLNSEDRQAAVDALCLTKNQKRTAKKKAQAAALSVTGNGSARLTADAAQRLHTWKQAQQRPESPAEKKVRQELTQERAQALAGATSEEQAAAIVAEYDRKMGRELAKAAKRHQPSREERQAAAKFASSPEGKRKAAADAVRGQMLEQGEFKSALRDVISTNERFKGRVQQVALHCAACIFADCNTTPTMQLIAALKGDKRAAGIVDYIAFLVSGADDKQSLIKVSNSKEKGRTVKYQHSSLLVEEVADLFTARKRATVWHTWKKAKAPKENEVFEMLSKAFGNAGKKMQEADLSEMTKHQRADLKKMMLAFAKSL